MRQIQTMYSFLFFISLLLTTQVCLCFKTPQIPLLNDIQIRDATFDDIDDIATVVIDAFSPAPVFDYLYQFRKQHPKYHSHCLQKGVQSMIKDALKSDILIKVIESTHKLKNKLNVVAVAVWETKPPFYMDRWTEAAFLSYASKSYDCSAQIDVNATRAIDFERQMSAASKRYIGDHDQIYLALLATHPYFDGNGYGAAHCHWGMSLAKERGLNVTLIATPAGHPLYKSLGFDEVKNITITNLDKEEGFWFEFMRWMPR